MRQAWASLFAAIALGGCGTGHSAGQPVSGTVRAAGLELTLLAVSMDDRPWPDEPLPRGRHCVVYELRARSIDGVKHDLRPGQFRAGAATPLDAVGHCSSPQIEPTWVSSDARTVWVTVLEAGPPATLMWRQSPP